MTTKIKGREYKVETMDTPALVSANLIANGWDGVYYMLTGKRGASYLACRYAGTDVFSIVS